MENEIKNENIKKEENQVLIHILLSSIHYTLNWSQSLPSISYITTNIT